MERLEAGRRWLAGRKTKVRKEKDRDRAEHNMLQDDAGEFLGDYGGQEMYIRAGSACSAAELELSPKRGGDGTSGNGRLGSGESRRFCLEPRGAAAAPERVLHCRSRMAAKQQ